MRPATSSTSPAPWLPGHEHRDPGSAAAVRAALRRLVAAHGFHGASMSAVAREAGVATGTAYVHYASKDDLVLAAYLEAKAALGAAATSAVDPDAPPRDRFLDLWTAALQHLLDHPEDARFLQQVEASPYAADAHGRAQAVEDDPLMAEVARPDMAALLAPLPLRVLWDLGLGPAVRQAASGQPLAAADRPVLAAACWHAITAG